MTRYVLMAAVVITLGAVPAVAEDDINIARGLRYARANCAKCHGVEANDTSSPVAAAPPFQTVAAMPSMTGRALTVWLESPHPSMPMLVVPDGERGNLISYILSLKGGQ